MRIPRGSIILACLLAPLALVAQQPTARGDSLGPAVVEGQPIRVQLAGDTAAGTYHAGRVVGVGTCSAVRLEAEQPADAERFQAHLFRAVLRAQVSASSAPASPADSGWVSVTPARLAQLAACDPTK